VVANRKPALLRKAFVIFALVLSGSGCRQLFGSPDRHLKVQPNREEMVGRWTIDAASIERIKSEQRFYPMSKLKPEDHLITLRGDGTSSFKTYSTFQFDSNYVVSEGRWELVMDEPVAGDEGKRASVKMTLTPTPNDYVIVSFWIARENDKLILWQYVGDPDRDKYADFHQVP
jgi:hypothetical protein